MEELPAGQFVVRVQATDRDQADDPNSLVSYAVTDVFATDTVGTLSPVSAFSSRVGKDVWNHMPSGNLCSSREVSSCFY